MNFLLFIILSGKTNRPFFVLGISFLFGVLLPIIVFIYFRKNDKIKDNDATVKEERTVPYLFGVLFCLAATLIFHFTGVESLFVNLWIIYFISSTIILKINVVWKISAHAMGVAIPLGALIYLGNSESFIFLFFLIVIAWARLTLRVHTFAQVLLGSIVGSIIPLIILRFLP